ncbi:MAG: histidine kinase [Eubacteriales bacterium]|nr:histidine kinase [Eubacteriales bacterium]
MRNLFKKKTIRRRMIVVQLAVIIPVMLLLGIILYQSTYSMLMTTNSDAYEKVLKSTDAVLGSNLEYYRDIARNVMADKVLQKELLASNLETENGKNLSQAAQVRIGKELESFMIQFSGLQSIYIFNTNGELLYHDALNEGSYVRDLDYEEISETDWFRESSEMQGYEKFIGYNVITGENSSFSCVKLLRDLDHMESLGMLILNFDKGPLRNILPSYDNEQGAYAILEEQYGNTKLVAYSKNSPLSQEEILQEINEPGGEYHLCTYEDETTGWNFAYLINRKYIVREAAKIRGILVEVLLMAIGALIVLTILVCNQISKPLAILKDNIIKVGEGERNIQNEYPDDEIGLIGREFSKMVNEKLSLSEKVTQVKLKNKEAELEQLQSNINPHFLYNTLDSLYWMAILHETEDIAELTRALSDIFKIALSKGEKFIPIREELDFVRNYLYIQNIRFENKIKVEIYADERLLDQKIIKLLLQPFVENAVYHGIEPKIEGGILKIRVYQEEKYLFFEISDDGVGMNVEQDISSGYAIRNSIERIRLVYGEEAYVKFDSEIGQGTRVVIRFPLDGEKNESSID